jgi:hypothetical protein
MFLYVRFAAACAAGSIEPFAQCRTRFGE